MSSTKELLVHVGLHKTGTTSIQAAFSTCADKLVRHGVLYPSTGRITLQHKLIPGCLCDSHLFMQDSARCRDAQFYFDELSNELRQHTPTLTILSSEVFTEIIEHRQGCLDLLQNLARPFEHVSLLVSLREEKQQALSSLKHRLRNGFGDEILDPIRSYRTILSGIQFARRFWQESGFAVREKWLEDHRDHLADHYFGDVLARHSEAACEILRNTRVEDRSSTRLNRDGLPALAYLLFVLLGNRFDSQRLLDQPLLNLILEECAYRDPRLNLDEQRFSNCLLAYVTFLAEDEPAPSSGRGFIPASRKLEALSQGGLSEQTVRVLHATANRIWLRATARTRLSD